MPNNLHNLLCIDIGNTNIDVCIQRGGKTVFERTPSNRRRSVGFFVRWLRREIEGDIDDCIISSVVPVLTEKLSQAVKDAWDIQPVLLHCGLRLDMPILIKNPPELGGDLIAGAVGAKQEFPLPCVVVDLGTATKFSVIDKNGAYLGCAIVPGVTSSFESLVHKAALLSGFLYEPPTSPVGTDTQESLCAGAYYGAASMVDGMCKRYEEYFGCVPSVVITGGNAPMVLPFCEYPMTYRQTLVVEGLKAIYSMNMQEQGETDGNK